MDGHNSHPFIHDDMAYDDLMATAGWPAPSEQPQYGYQQHPTPDAYGRYTTNQPSYDQFSLSQQAQYPPVTYSNSPYASQFQHARPSDVFGPTSFNVDPSLSSSTSYHGHDSAFSFDPHNMDIESATVSPQSLQYSMPQSQSLNRTMATSNLQRQQNALPNNFNQRTQSPTPTYYHPSQNAVFQQTQNNNNVHYPILPIETETDSKQQVKKVVDAALQSAQLSAQRVQQSRPAPVPNPLRITRPELVEETAKNKNFFEFAPFLTWEDEPVQSVPSGLKTALPKYHPRKSRSGKDLVPGLDLSAVLKAESIAKPRGRPPKVKAPLSSYKGTSGGPKPSTVSKLRDISGSGVKSPSTPTETSSSEEEESSSEEESEYEEESEMPLIDISTIRGHTRPTNTAEATRWDAIGIIWKDPNSSPSSDVVKEAIQKYGDFVSALRVQVKTNSTKIDEAAARPAEVQRLKQERVVLLDSLYQAIDAANIHGYGAIVENLGGHHKLVNGLTTTLIECIKADDFQGKLPKAVFSLLAKFQTMSDDLLRKLKFDSIQKRWNKKGDDETKKDIVTILASTTDAKERVAKAQKNVEQLAKEKKMREKVEQTKVRNTESTSSSGSATTKRPHEGDSTNGKANKKFALDTTSTLNPSSKPTPLKRSGANLLGIASKPIAKPIPKKRDVSPPTESKLGAILASIAKPPEAPKAPVAPPRAPETPEEKTRRERKESRRHLRVKFKDGPELEQIRLFKHEQAEDEGRQDEMLRDAHDDRLEGMMHKQRVSETIDDDEEYQPSEADLPYPEPVEIDFSGSQKSTRFGPTYVTRGGDLPVVTPEQKTQQRREGLELMVFYTDPNDIPPTPKEPHPTDLQMDGATDYEPEHELKTPTEPWIVQRLNEIHQYGPEQASQIALNRQSEQQWKARDHQSHQPFAGAQPNAGNVFPGLQKLGGPAQQLTQEQTQHDKQVLEQVCENLRRIADSVKGLPYPAVEPPRWMTNPHRQEWIDNLAKDNAAKIAKEQAEAERNIAQLQAAQYQQPPIAPPQYQQQPPAPQMPPMMQPQIPYHTQPLDAQQVQSYLAAFQNGDSNAGQPQMYDYSAWAQNGVPSTGAQDEGSNYAGQAQYWGNENSNPNTNRAQEKSGGKSKRGYDIKMADSPFDENGEYKGKKKPCRFYREGKCAKGAKCTYLHD